MIKKKSSCSITMFMDLVNSENGLVGNVGYYTENIEAPVNCVLVCDIGGTNARLALVEVGENKLSIIFVLRALTKNIHSFTDIILQALEIAHKKYAVIVTKAVFALPGCPTQNADIWSLPNVGWDADKKEIIQKTSLTDVSFLNDFEAIGYSIDVLMEKDFVCINPGIRTTHKNKLILGAGTDLGECVIAWDSISGNYVVVAAEGALADFSGYNNEDLALITFLQNKLNNGAPIRYGNLVSGIGVSRIYQFFEQQGIYVLTDYSSIIKKHNYDPAVIIQYNNVDECCKKTIDTFKAFYGRVTKNFALGARAYGVIYLAGGIAAKNIDIFKDGIFMAEFLNTAIYKDLLVQTPIFIIINEDAGLLGAARFFQLKNKKF